MPNPPYFRSRRRTGFTIIEIMVILVIIALMMVIIVPHVLMNVQVRKADRVRADLNTLNNAIEHYALDNGKTAGTPVAFADLQKYLDPTTDVVHRNGNDLLGEPYGPFVVGARPSIPPRAKSKMEEIVPEDFWSPYR